VSRDARKDAIGETKPRGTQCMRSDGP